VAAAVRERFPNIQMIWGGWFPSAIPELYLNSNICDAVAIGQGEITFGEYLQAVENGTPLEKVAGLALKRDGQMMFTGNRATVHLNELPEPSFHLIDLQKYYELQKRTAKFGNRVRNRLPPPHHLANKPHRGFSYFSSFGCPEPCSFCCSPSWPAAAGWRWTRTSRGPPRGHPQGPLRRAALPGRQLRRGQERMQDFCEGLLSRALTSIERHIEIKQICQYDWAR
jgi:radical SAM superfamily enzyme YgiQ (UPF0313 family)